MTPRTRTILAILIISLFSTAAASRAANMKLLTPDVGWVLSYPGLMWTTDGGAHWTNINPPLPTGEHIVSVFFMDTQYGWALLSGTKEGSEEPHFDLAATDDSGATWSVTPVTIPGLHPGMDLAGSGHIYFTDSEDGWANLDIVSNLRPALLIETHDGGRTWNWPPSSPGVAGELLFINSVDGWLEGGPGGGELYATRDGGESWREIHLKTLLDGSVVTCGASGTPFFTGGEKGYLPAGCLGGTMVLYATDDGGQSWKSYRTLRDPFLKKFGGSLPSTVAASTWMAVKASRSVITLLTVSLGPLGGAMEATSTAVPGKSGRPAPAFGVLALSFANSVDGWVLVQYRGTTASLLSTSDGGRTWADITPRIPMKPLPPAAPMRRRPMKPLIPPTGRATGPG